MPTSFGRIRQRHTPMGALHQVELGRYFPGIKVNGVYTGMYSQIPEKIEVHNYALWSGYKRLSQLCMDSVHPGPPYLSGGDFSALKYDWCSPYGGVYGGGEHRRSDLSQKFIGGFHAPSNYDFGGNVDGLNFDFYGRFGSLLDTVNNPSFPSMIGLGDKAYSATKPKIEQASAFVFLAEARDVPRMLKHASQTFHETWKAMGGKPTPVSMAPKKLSGDFLAYQFGWKPFVKDLIKFNDVVQNYHPMISKIASRNDRWVRRRVTLGSETQAKILFDGVGNKCFPTAIDQRYVSGLPNYSLTQTKTTETTGVGKFRYYRPEFDLGKADYMSTWNHAARVATTFGFRMNPSNIYKAIPWTWLIDWFSNVGDHIDHLNDVAVDSVVCKYAFVMTHQTTRRVLTQHIPWTSGVDTLTFTRILESKQRQQASSPYGFSLSWDSLTPRQLAILAALGIGRSKIAG